MPANHSLTRDVDQLHTLVFELQSQVEVLKNQLLQMKRQVFGPRHEKVDLQQFPLFDSDDIQIIPVDEPKTLPSPATDRTPNEKRSAVRVLKSLPVRVEVVDLPAHDQLCQCCGCSMAAIGSDVSRQIEYSPAQLFLKETHRKEYACRSCELDIKRAPKPYQAIPKSMASAGLLSYLIVSKFADHLPYYRIEKRLSRLGLCLS